MLQALKIQLLALEGEAHQLAHIAKINKFDTLLKAVINKTLVKVRDFFNHIITQWNCDVIKKVNAILVP